MMSNEPYTIDEIKQGLADAEKRLERAEKTKNDVENPFFDELDITEECELDLCNAADFQQDMHLCISCEGYKYYCDEHWDSEVTKDGCCLGCAVDVWKDKLWEIEHLGGCT